MFLSTSAKNYTTIVSPENTFVNEHEIDCIINCAAYTAVDKAEENEELCDILNHIAPGYLAKAVESRGGCMIHISTDYVFDGTGHIPYKEEEPTCPNTVYGRTNLACEQAVMTGCKQSVVIRTAWLYSTFGNNFVKTMIRLGREKDNLGVIFDQVGTPTYARDLARAIFIILKLPQFRFPSILDVPFFKKHWLKPSAKLLSSSSI